MPTKSDETLSELTSRVYSDQTWLRALVNCVPYIGGGLDVLLTSTHEKVTAKRIAIFIAELSSRLENVEESINSAFIESEEFYDIFTLSIEKVARISEEERIKTVSRIIADTASGMPTDTIHPVDLIAAICELSNQESAVLGKIIEIYAHKKELLTGSYNDLLTIETIKLELNPILQSSADFLCSRLVGKGLINQGYGYYSLSEAGSKIRWYLQVR